MVLQTQELCFSCESNSVNLPKTAQQPELPPYIKQQRFPCQSLRRCMWELLPQGAFTWALCIGVWGPGRPGSKRADQGLRPGTILSSVLPASSPRASWLQQTINVTVLVLTAASYQQHHHHHQNACQIWITLSAMDHLSQAVLQLQQSHMVHRMTCKSLRAITSSRKRCTP